MRWRRLFVMVSMLSCFVISCTPLRLQQVREGLSRTVSELPQSDDFTIVTVLSGEFYDTFGGTTCYYAGASIAVGSRLPASTAWDIYIDELQSQGWVLEQDDMQRTKVLVRGRNERMSVRSDPPGWEMELEESYQRAQTAYPTFVYLIVKYFLPSREDCV